MSRSGEFGLLLANKHTPIPLRDVSVKAEVKGYVLGLKSTLKYTNDSSDPVEVLFRFPLEDSHAVVALTAVIDGRKIKADIREKEEARAAYDDAIASGQSAALGEEKTGDIFSLSLGNLPPGKDAEVYLELVGELPIDAEGNVRFSLPSTLKPRYTPAGSTDPLANVSGAPESQVEHASVPGVCGFELSILNATQQVVDVTSPTHTLKSIRDNDADKMVVSLGDEKSLDTDLVILIEHKNVHQPSVLVEEGKKGEGFMSNPAVMVNFFPDFEHVETACEFIFLVDRSGSMSGSYIQSARETLMLFMKSLPESCRFNIIGFGSRYEWLFFSDVSVQYSQETLDKAMSHLQTLRADLGGTELLPPLQDIFSKKTSSGFSRQVFVLTDGSVSNTQRCIDKVKENAHSARCFTFGIGSGASTSLVEGLAKAGNGSAEFVKGGERMQPKVIRSLKRALQPSVTDVSVDFQVQGQCDVLQSPSILPPIYNGEKLVVYGVMKPRDSVNETAVEGTAILKGNISGKEIFHSLSFKVCPTTRDPLPSTTVHHLAAKALLKDWQNEKKDKDQIVKLSIEASVISAHTAFIAVDEESSECINAPMKTWDVQAGGAFLGLEDNLFLSRNSFCSSDDDSEDELLGMGEECELIYEEETLPMSMSVTVSSNFIAEELYEDMCEESLPMTTLAAAPSRVIAEEPKRSQAAPIVSVVTPSKGLSAIVNAQQANGSWKFDSTLAQLLKKTMKELEDGCPTEVKGDMASIWATVLVLSLLKKEFSSQQEEWELIAMKAESWLSKQALPSGVSKASLVAVADRVV